MNGVKTDDLAREVESQYLLFAVLINHVTLEATRTNRRNGLKFITGAENVLPGLDRAGLQQFRATIQAAMDDAQARAERLAETNTSRDELIGLSEFIVSL